MKEKAVFEYYDRDEFLTFLRELPRKEAAKLLVTIEKISKFGLLIAQEQQWVKKLETNLFEIRSHHGSNSVRAIYFHKEGKYYVITHGFKKKTNKTPIKEIARAKAIRTKFLGSDNDEN